jgi:hypothetical protein
MKILKQLISAVTLSILASTAVAQTVETTPNLITSGTTHTWTGVTTGSYSVACPPGGGACSGGPGALYDPNTNTIYFSYGQSTAAQTFAINQALANSGSGIVVQGYNYSWDILNNNNYRTDQSGTDTIIARVITFDPTGAIRRTDSWTYNTKFDWTTFSGSVNYVTPGPTSEFGNLRVEFSGSDSGFWGGYFGPQVRNVSIGLNYTVDPCVSNPQGNPSCPGYKTYYNIGDDSYAIVPIPFGFPFYGQLFTHSLMFDNGVVSFYSPTHTQRFGGQQFYAESLSQFTGSQFYYSIMPLWTDLLNYSGSFYTQQSSNHLKYTWENVSQFGYPDRLNTFSLEIRPTGYIGLQYQQVNIEGYPVTVGMVGNASLGEYNELYRQSDGGLTTTANLQNWGITETIATDCSNPLNNVNCPGYAEALFQQQCSANVLYSPACPGYAEAYFTQQCSINTLYDPLCPGYVTAYYNYQCSLSALYHTGCPGYAQAYFDQQCGLDPLYNEACPGHAQAYFDQQCTLDPLYNNQCPSYADAFYVQQCTLDPLYDNGCTGYEQAYFDQQCSLDPLYNNQCPGYTTAFYNQQCSINTLYDSACPGYAQAYFDQQCSLDPLYNNQCPGYTTAFYNQQCSLDALYDKGCNGYSEAYAKKFILNISSDPIAAKTEPEPVVTAIATTVEDPVAKAEPVVEEKIVVAQAETKKETVSTSPAGAATAPVSLTAPSATAATAALTSRTETKTEAPRTAGPARTAPTTRQALAEQRLAAAREQAAQSARENPGATTAALDSAESMEQQAELQNVVVGAMSFVPGFDAYGRATLPDAAGYKPFEIYPGQRNIDTPAARGLLGRSDRLHQEMVDEQYK